MGLNPKQTDRNEFEGDDANVMISLKTCFSGNKSE